MTLKSMTGFARDRADAEGFTLQWEAKSVNGKGLDVRCRVPSLLDGLDLAARKRAALVLGCGSVTPSLSLDRPSGGDSVSINRARLDALLDESEAVLAEKAGAVTPPSLGDLLQLPGMIETDGRRLDEDGHARLEAAALAGLDRVLAALVAVRDAEGASLASQLAAHVDAIAELVVAAGHSAAARPETVRARLDAKLSALLPDQDALDAGRLEQEVAMLTIKQDVREELERLDTHVAAARTLLRSDEPVGRRLDFLAQEFNREANTLCSKSQDADLTRIGLDMKTAIDQFREQIQNVE